MSHNSDDLGEVLIELRPIGAAMRVTAIHTATMTEVVVQCPLRLSEFEMKNVALKKMRYVLNKLQTPSV